MHRDRAKAEELRREGKSYKEINSLLYIPKSTLSDWFKFSDWSKIIKRKNINKEKQRSKIRICKLNTKRGKDLSNLYKEAEKEALIELENLKYFPLFIAGLVIYWGEGEKISKHQVRVSNTDFEMIKMFYKFLRDVCGVENKKIRVSLLLYPDLNENECIKIWREKTGIKKENFNASVVIHGRHKTKRVRYGVCIIGVSSSYLKKKMLVWIDFFPKLVFNEIKTAGIS